MRIAIVNDMRAACEALRRVVDSLPDHEIAWTAADGVEAIAMAKRDRPDLILMDLIMPHVDGVQATRQIMAASPCAILIVTATVSGNVAGDTDNAVTGKKRIGGSKAGGKLCRGQSKDCVQRGQCVAAY
jgi:chemotaxis response regulator CheB